LPLLFYIRVQYLLRLGLELLLDLATGLDALQDSLTVLVKLELGDDDLGGVDAERDGLSRGLLADNTLDVNDVLETVDGGDLSLTTLVGATNDGDLVILADWDRANLTLLDRFWCWLAPYTYVVLLTELLAERGAHDSAANTGWGAEVRLARLPAGGVEG
jgi:hypothetical protein